MAKRTSRKANSNRKFLFGLGDLMDRLSIVNIKASILESIIKSPSSGNAKAGIAAKLIRKINTERNAIKSVINEFYGHGYEDIKVEYFELLEHPYRLKDTDRLLKNELSVMRARKRKK